MNVSFMKYSNSGNFLVLCLLMTPLVALERTFLPEYFIASSVQSLLLSASLFAFAFRRNKNRHKAAMNLFLRILSGILGGGILLLMYLFFIFYILI